MCLECQQDGQITSRGSKRLRVSGQPRTVILMERNKSRREGDLAFDEVTLDTEGRRSAGPRRVYPNRSMAFNLGEARQRSVSDSCRWCQLRREKRKKTPQQTKQKPRSSDREVEERQRGREAGSVTATMGSVSELLSLTLYSLPCFQRKRFNCN